MHTGLFDFGRSYQRIHIIHLPMFFRVILLAPKQSYDSNRLVAMVPVTLTDVGKSTGIKPP